MFLKSLLFVPLFAIATGALQPALADDATLAEIQNELAEAKQSLLDATKRLRRVEAKIADLKRSDQLGDVDGTDFAWRVLGMRVAEIPDHEISDTDKSSRTKYRGAIKVTAVRVGGPAASQGIRIGDLLLEIDGIQTTSNTDIRVIANRESEMITKRMLNFFILRNGQTLFGNIALAQ